MSLLWRTSVLPVHPCQDVSENRMKSNLYFILKLLVKGNRVRKSPTEHSPKCLQKLKIYSS